MRPAAILLSLALLAAPAARACDIALVLAIDVSGSVDAGEYRLQVDGLADALADPDVTEALVSGEAALAVLQWSALRMQAVTQDWQRMFTPADVTLFAAEARATPRAFDGADTAVSNALADAIDLLERGPTCRRRVIDISGDGPQNAGIALPPVRGRAIAQGIEINAIAIEDIGVSVTEFYRRLVITKGGFVMTARGHLDYPRAIREKILREVVKPGA